MNFAALSLPVVLLTAICAVLLIAIVVLVLVIRGRRIRIRELEASLKKQEQVYTMLKTETEQKIIETENSASQAKTALSLLEKSVIDRDRMIAGLEEKCRQLQGQLLSARNLLMEAVDQRDLAKKEALTLMEKLEEDTGNTEEMLERLSEAEARAEQCDRFIRAFGTDAESFFSRPDAEPRLRRMAAEYLTMVYDASASYLEDKPRPALTEARRIRELKSETQEWIDRALRAEYDLAQRPLQRSEQLYLFSGEEE
ncbi:MAG: hypothetical protein IKM31_04530 [Oscillospiraceae bacterium]|nr:hypothetical protein [Oscillospiraceae bacterium]